MSNAHRLAWIDAQIRERRYPNCRTIAGRFSISLRQAARDIEYLRDSMGAPLEYCRVKRGYYYTESSYVHGHVVITEEQRQSLSYMADHYARLESEHARHLSRLFRRLIDNSDDSAAELALPLFPADPGELAMFDTLYRAVRSHTKVDVTESSVDGGRPQTIRLSPYHVYAHQLDNYVVGFCEPEGRIRFFAVSSLQRAEETDAPFDLTPLLKHANIAPELLSEPDIAMVHFDAESYAETLPFRAERVAPHLFRVAYYEPDRLLAALLACPAGCSVRSPSWLRNRYISLLENKLRHQLEYDILRPGPSVMMEWNQTSSEPSIILKGELKI